MSMKKTDLEKRLAKKIEGRLKARVMPQRFGTGSVAPAKQEESVGDKSRSVAAAAPAAGRLVTVSVRLPAVPTQRLRALAVGREGGISTLVAEAVDQWLATAGSPVAKS